MGENNRVRVNNISISYDVLGEGAPIVLVHGFASNRIINWKNTGWYKFLVSQGRQVIALDLRGHGESEKLYGIQAYTPEVMCRDILSLMDYLEVSRADIMGYSMGATLTAHLLGTHAERFISGVLGGFGSGVLALRTRAERIAEALTTTAPESITDRFLKTLRGFAESLNNDLRALAACNRGVYAQGTLPLDKIPHPVLIVGGENDDVVGSPHAFVDAVGHAELVMVPGKDHISLVTARLFKEKVGEFLRHGN